ncbi:MAG: universal stress protein, partial [Weissella confusa]|nr:universal stress protein [Weissella confusa]
APEIKADLLIVGAHSKQGMWPSLGSQAVYIARHAKISSLIARR